LLYRLEKNFVLGNFMDEAIVTRNIKELRQKKKITLEKLASIAHLTKGYLCKIEKSKKAPPFSTLNKIAQALGADISTLLKENREESSQDIQMVITRKDERKVVVTKGSLYGYTYEAIALEKAGKNMIPYIITPASKEKATFKHAGEEFIFVLEGRTEFIYKGKKYVMEKGDAVYFDSSVSHSGSSIGKKKAKLLSVMFNYKRI
jgi:transcriptional regulator with XRE-family HTH domain